ncbi:MAG: extracellular solute-binding protein [Betaproteobacteria bacterium]|nr:extracellular solute-binding protein [Betaproteobacteria bacterium]
MSLKNKFFLGAALTLVCLSCTRKPERVLKVLTFRDRQSSALRAALPVFEKEFSVRVQFDDIPASTVATKMMTDLAAGGTYDVYAVDEPFIPQFHEALLPVEQWPRVSAQDDLSGFESKAIEAARFQGVTVGLPVNGNVYQYIFRKDLFEESNEQVKFQKQYNRPLKPATNFTELLELAQFFHRPPKLYGFAPFTKMSEGTTVELLWLLAGFGYKPGATHIDTPTVARALELYDALLKTAPKAARAWHHTERMSAYAKGRVAQMMTWNSFFFDLEDEHKSLVVGRTGYAPSPGSEANGIAGTWIAGIRKNSAEAELAATFVRWWTSKDVNEGLIPKGLSTARADLLTRSDLATKFPWLGSTHLNFNTAFLRPRHKQYRSTSDDLSKAFTRWIAGQKNLSETASDIQAALGRMNELALSGTQRQGAH